LRRTLEMSRTKPSRPGMRVTSNAFDEKGRASGWRVSFEQTRERRSATWRLVRRRRRRNAILMRRVGEKGRLSASVIERIAGAAAQPQTSRVTVASPPAASRLNWRLRASSQRTRYAYAGLIPSGWADRTEIPARRPCQPLCLSRGLRTCTRTSEWAVVYLLVF
jgi:hypothetical protein